MIVVVIVLICVTDLVVLPLYFSFMDMMCDLSANIARVFKSLSPEPLMVDGL